MKSDKIIDTQVAVPPPAKPTLSRSKKKVVEEGVS